MTPVRQMLCPPGRYGIKCPFLRTPTRIVVHNTANDAPAENEIAYMIDNDNEVSYHYAVDDREIVQGLPLDRNAWASGDGRGRGNMEGIHIEICYSLSGGPRFEQAEKNAAELIAHLLKQYGWGMDRVTKHRDYDGKYCPHRTLDLGWQRFLDLIKAQDKEGEAVTYEQWKAFQTRYEQELAEKPEAAWAGPHIARVREAGVMQGDAAGGFRPRSPVTRQELAAVAAALLDHRTTNG